MVGELQRAHHLVALVRGVQTLEQLRDAVPGLRLGGFAHVTPTTASEVEVVVGVVESIGHS